MGRWAPKNNDQVCPGRQCEGPCMPLASDCYLRRSFKGYPPMMWMEEWGPEPPMSHYVEDGMRRLLDGGEIPGVTDTRTVT